MPDGVQAGPVDSLRAFVAIAIPESVRSRLQRSQSRLRRLPVKVSWVRPENIHLTLVFLGEIPTTALDSIQDVLDDCAAPVAPFEFAVFGLGLFGSRRAPRVIWAGIPEPPHDLLVLQDALQERFLQAGWVRPMPLFHPHVTLGRIRGGQGAAQLTSVIASANNSDFGAVPVRRVQLVQSRLEADGVRYALIHESGLKGT